MLIWQHPDYVHMLCPETQDMHPGYVVQVQSLMIYNTGATPSIAHGSNNLPDEATEAGMAQWSVTQPLAEYSALEDRVTGMEATLKEVLDLIRMQKISNPTPTESAPVSCVKVTAASTTPKSPHHAPVPKSSASSKDGHTGAH